MKSVKLGQYCSVVITTEACLGMILFPQTLALMLRRTIRPFTEHFKGILTRKDEIILAQSEFLKVSNRYFKIVLKIHKD